MLRNTTLLLSCLFLSFSTLKAQDSPVGAWKSTTGTNTVVLLITPNYFSVAVFSGKTFLTTYGGTWQEAENGKIAAHIEFNSGEKAKVGQKVEMNGSIENGKLITSEADGKMEWERIDNGDNTMTGVWQISGREQNGKINPIVPGARKTIKILSESRFQWIAINTATGEFFGTGGGTYTFKDGKYVENIDFFSRDSTRVGASLSFNGKVDEGKWDHSGLSSKGDPIHEIWTKQ